MSALVVASNRGPLQFTLDEDGSLSRKGGAGGLISALTSALKEQACTWISAALTRGDEVVAESARSTAVAPQRWTSWQLRMLLLDKDIQKAHYQEISNRTLWFLHHHLLDTRTVTFDNEFFESWNSYRFVNDQFAQACDSAADAGAEVHIEDYHLSLAPRLLRGRRSDLRIVHQVYCPWSDPGDFSILPEVVANELLHGMLGADVIGFLAARWAGNFLRSCDAAGLKVDWERGVVRTRDERCVHVRSFPLGVDPVELRRRLSEAEPERFLQDHEARLIVRVDRMEPAKNIVRGLEGFAAFLELHPSYRRRVEHLVITNLSRQSIAEYRRYRAEVERRVDQINSRFGCPGWTPVRLIVLDDHPRALRALAVADAVVVNPLWDGMNLIAKEAMCVNERDASLILSRNAGAAEELADGALLVNPFDVVELANAIHRALSMDQSERRERAAKLRAASAAMPPVAWFAARRQALVAGLGRDC
jgi:trehalose 6-phosphate synthase